MPISAGMLLGCDPSHQPELCNGLNQAITLQIVYEDNQKINGSLPANTCSRERAPGMRYKSVSVVTSDGKLLEAFNEDILKPIFIQQPSKNLHFLITETGLFSIPERFQYDWRNHITEIEMTGSLSRK